MIRDSKNELKAVYETLRWSQGDGNEQDRHEWWFSKDGTWYLNVANGLHGALLDAWEHFVVTEEKRVEMLDKKGKILGMASVFPSALANPMTQADMLAFIQQKLVRGRARREENPAPIAI
jgi:hypothetical protein